MKTKYTYAEAFHELERIVTEIETGETNVDELTKKIQRASELIAICKAKLVSSEAEVEKLLHKLTPTEEEQTQDLTDNERNPPPAK